MTFPHEESKADHSARVLITVAERLTGVLRRETSMLRSRCPQEIAALGAEKERLSRAWQAGLDGLRQQSGAATEMSAELRVMLHQEVAELQHAAAENDRALRAAMKATERLLKVFASAVAENRAGAVGYAQNRRAPNRIGSTAGIALDKRL